MSFASFKLDESILKNLEDLGYQEPTPIQEQALPIALEGKDIIGLAQTGTGKTAAFALPILQKLLTGPRGHVRALVIAPTRELAEQIHKEFGKLGKGSKLRGVTLYGGVRIDKELRSLSRGVDIVIACPGRLLDHVNRRTVDLSQVELVVLDEADHMFDMGFIENIKSILEQLPKHPKRQSLLFSATMPSEVRNLAEKILVNPHTIQVNTVAPAHTVTQTFYPVSELLKSALLLKILETTETQSTLIFTRTKHRATQLASLLASKGFIASSFQGNLTQIKRQITLNRFREGKLPILVATDIAARGIDIARVSHVINFDMPNTIEAYTHRIGRTGRASKLGSAFTFITRSDTPRVRAIERLFKQKVEFKHLPNFDYKAAASPDLIMPQDNTIHSRSPMRSSFRPSQSASEGQRRSRTSFGTQSSGYPDAQRKRHTAARKTSKNPYYS